MLLYGTPFYLGPGFSSHVLRASLSCLFSWNMGHGGGRPDEVALVSTALGSQW